MLNYVTGLIKSGVKQAEAKELARHSDVQLTMKYTHLGLEDQALAVNRLPWNGNKGKPSVNKGEGSWQRYGSGTRHANGHSMHRLTTM